MERHSYESIGLKFHLHGLRSRLLFMQSEQVLSLRRIENYRVEIQARQLAYSCSSRQPPSNHIIPRLRLRNLPSPLRPLPLPFSLATPQRWRQTRQARTSTPCTLSLLLPLVPQCPRAPLTNKLPPHAPLRPSKVRRPERAAITLIAGETAARLLIMVWGRRPGGAGRGGGAERPAVAAGEDIFDHGGGGVLLGLSTPGGGQSAAVEVLELGGVSGLVDVGDRICLM